MNLQELFELVDDLRAEVEDDDDAMESVLVLATQPSWPLEYDVEKIVVVRNEDGSFQRLAIAEGSHRGYLSRDVKYAVDW
jgi:hypothetical protein